MYSAPPVVVPVGRFVLGPRIVLVLCLLVGALCLLAAVAYGTTASRASAMALVWVLVACMSWALWRREALEAGELSWDGEGWWWRSTMDTALPVTVEVSWDAGRAMLLRLSGDNKQGWRIDRHAWMQTSQLPVQWHGLRCAIYCHNTL